jgi:hypothetical protein
MVPRYFSLLCARRYAVASSSLAHAYAVLELSPPITAGRLKRQYRALVRRWHPDRFRADPAGEAEANQKLREINLAYELVVAFLESPDPPEDFSSREGNVPPVSSSTERVDAIVDSINRMNRISLVPELSVQRWLSIAVAFGYLIDAIMFLPTNGSPSRRIGEAVFNTAGYLMLPLILIWIGDRDDGSFNSVVCRIFGWFFLLAPALYFGFL